MTKKKQQNTAKLSKLKTELSALRKFKRQVRFEMKCLHVLVNFLTKLSDLLVIKIKK